MIARRYLPPKRDLLAERRAQIDAVRAAKIREAARLAAGQRPQHYPFGG